jgi:hypothetical protein
VLFFRYQKLNILFFNIPSTQFRIVHQVEKQTKMELINKTKPNELTDIKIQPWCQTVVDRAFTESQKLLTIQEFIKVVEFKIDAFMVDKCFLNLKEDIPVYIDAPMLEWMGYKGKEKAIKQNFMKMLGRNFEKDTDYYDFKNKEYQEWLDNNRISYGMHMHAIRYPPITTVRGSYQSNHIIMPPDTFRKVLLMLNTTKANAIREYYISLEKLIKVYMTYQSLFRHREACSAMTEKDSNINQLIKEVRESEAKADEARAKADDERSKSEARFQKLLGVADATRAKADDERAKSDEARAKADDERDKSEARFQKLLGVAEYTKDEVIEERKISTNERALAAEARTRAIPRDVPSEDKTQVWILRDKSSDDEDFNLYTIRTQLKNMKNSIKKLKKKWGDDLVVTYKIEQPNAVIFWNLIKNKYSQNITKCPESNWFKLKDINLRKFKIKINNMNKFRCDN